MSDTTKRRFSTRRIIDATETLVSAASGIALICVALAIAFNASGRYLIGWSFLGGEEFARLLTVWITFVGAFALVRSESHVNIDLVLRAVPPAAQRVFRGVVGVLGLLVCSYLAWTSFQLTSFSFGTGQMGTTLPVPRGLFFLPVFVGAVLMLIAFGEITLRAVTNTLPPLKVLGTDVEERVGAKAESGDS